MARWYVDAAATGSHNGTSPANAWTTFAQIVQASLVGGDIVYVQSGTYNEQFVVTKGGTNENNRITYLGIGPTKPILLGVKGTATNWVAFLRLEITQPITSAVIDDAFYMLGGCHGWKIEDCYIHDTIGGGISEHTTPCHSGIYRHNQFDNVTWTQTGFSNGNTITIGGNANLVEYNTLGNVLDRVYLNWGTGNVIRNNAYTGSNMAGFTKTVVYQFHVDGIQGGSQDGIPVWRQNLFEKTWDTNSVGTDTHHCTLQDYSTSPSGNTSWFLSRFNVCVRQGGGYLLQNMSGVYLYNITTIRLGENTVGGLQNSAFFYASDNAGGAIGTGAIMDLRNNTWSYCTGTVAQSGGGGLVSWIATHFPPKTASTNEHAYNDTGRAGSLQPVLYSGAVGYLPTGTNPLFVNTGTDDYRLQAGSPLRGAGAPITTASGDGSNSQQLWVFDPQRLFDGWGIADADTIKIGSSGGYVKISGINYTNGLVTLTSGYTWVSGSGVWVKGSEDIGAQPFAFTQPLFVKNLSSGIASGVGGFLQATGNSDCIRKVEFLVDGLPIGESYTNPYAVAWTGDGGFHTGEARAYNMWASIVLSVSDTVTFGTGGGGQGSVLSYRRLGSNPKMVGLSFY